MAISKVSRTEWSWTWKSVMNIVRFSYYKISILLSLNGWKWKPAAVRNRVLSYLKVPLSALYPQIFLFSLSTVFFLLQILCQEAITILIESRLHGVCYLCVQHEIIIHLTDTNLCKCWTKCHKPKCVLCSWTDVSMSLQKNVQNNGAGKAIWTTEKSTLWGKSAEKSYSFEGRSSAAVVKGNTSQSRFIGSGSLSVYFPCMCFLKKNLFLKMHLNIGYDCIKPY